jgi:hypothetical protein
MKRDGRSAGKIKGDVINKDVIHDDWDELFDSWGINGDIFFLSRFMTGARIYGLGR